MCIFDKRYHFWFLFWNNLDKNCRFLKFGDEYHEIFRFHDYFFLVPLIAPLVGATIGAYSYELFIGFHIPDTVTSEVTHEKLKGGEKVSLKYVSDIMLTSNIENFDSKQFQ